MRPTTIGLAVLLLGLLAIGGAALVVVIT